MTATARPRAADQHTFPLPVRPTTLERVDKCEAIQRITTHQCPRARLTGHGRRSHVTRAVRPKTLPLLRNILKGTISEQTDLGITCRQLLNSQITARRPIRRRDTIRSRLRLLFDLQILLDTLQARIYVLALSSCWRGAGLTYYL